MSIEFENNGDFYSFTGNRWQSIIASQLGHDDEVHGPETRTRTEDLQSSKSTCTKKALIIIGRSAAVVVHEFNNQKLRKQYNTFL